MTESQELNQIAERLPHVGLATTLEALENFSCRYPALHLGERLASIREEYELMASYWRDGQRDGQRTELFNRLCNRCSRVLIDAHVRLLNSHTPFFKALCKKSTDGTLDADYADMLRSRLEKHVTDLAMLELEQPHVAAARRGELFERHAKLMGDVFGMLLTSCAWRDGFGTAMADLMLSPTVDAMDQQLMVSAVTLGCLNVFDPAKFRALFRVYRESTDERVRQRALVGWALMARDYFECYDGMLGSEDEVVETVAASASMSEELADLQMQLVYCLDADADNRTINEEIMPDLMSYTRRHNMPDGQESDDEALRDIIDPEASEREMERAEENFRRMMEMQQQGSDIYFSGFAQMKRFPFFDDVSNWFVPYYKDNPAIASFVKDGLMAHVMERLLWIYPFCDSDKYSLVLAYMKTFDRMGEAVREQVVSSVGVDLSKVAHMPPQEVSTAFMRRTYLQDLYRFFRVFTSRECFRNPFEGGETTRPCFFVTAEPVRLALLGVEAITVRIASFMLKRGHLECAAAVLNGQGTRDGGLQYLMLCGTLASKGFEIAGVSKASYFYAKAMGRETDGHKARVAHARALFREGDVAGACLEYRDLARDFPDVHGYRLAHGICLLNLSRGKEALPLLFQCEYERPDDVNVKRALARALLEQGRLADASRLYAQLLKLRVDEGGKAEDALNAALCMWLHGKPGDAAPMLAGYLHAQYPDDTKAELLQRYRDDIARREHALLGRFGYVDLKLMEDEVWSRL